MLAVLIDEKNTRVKSDGLIYFPFKNIEVEVYRFGTNTQDQIPHKTEVLASSFCSLLM
jgi:hypothetical protein